MDELTCNPGTIAHPCRWCGEIITSSDYYCSYHCEDRFMTWLKTKPSAIRGEKPPFWNLIRRLALERDNHQCQYCGSSSNLSVHHILPLSLGGDSTLENLRVLCHACHQKEHGNHVRFTRKKRLKIRIRHQPMYVSATLFGDWIRRNDIEVYS